jgi:hypothetical protein
MPISTIRPSLTTNLETRYSTQHIGGAFDAFTLNYGDFGLLERIWTKAGFVAALAEGLGLLGAKTYVDSLYRQGLDETKYKP